MTESLDNMKVVANKTTAMDLVTELPEEILEVILEQLQDLSNVFCVYPQLKNIFIGHLWSWLITDVMPFLYPKYLNIRDIKTCRLVSKRWKNAICQTIQTHPDCLPYKSGSLSKMTETHFNYHRLSGNPVNLGRMLNSEWFKRNNAGLYTNEYPFPGHIYINVKTDNTMDNELRSFRGNIYVRPPIKIDLHHAIPILQQNGHHVISLTLKICSLFPLTGDQILNKVIHPLFQCLAYLPNLKRFKFLKCSMRIDNISQAKLYKIKDIISTASLPFQLESLNIFQADNRTDFLKNIFDRFMKTFVNHENIEKLVMFSHTWNHEYSVLFPNLKDLRLKMTGWIYPHPDKLALQNILHDLRHSPIRKIQLNAKEMYVGDILEVLAPYQIENIVLLGDIKEHRKIQRAQNKSSFSKVGRSIKAVVSSKRSSDQATDDFMDEVGTCVMLPSVQSLRLKLQRNCVWFEFLTSFPSLKYITVEIKPGGWSLSHVGEWQRYVNSTNGFYKSLKHFYHDGNCSPVNWKFVWDDIPKLKILTVMKNGKTYQYARECKNKVFTS